MKNILTAVLIIVCLLSISCNKGKNQDTGKTDLPENLEYQLSDPQATSEAAILFNNLWLISASSILIGHQDALAYGIGWKGDEFRTDINDVCGDFPAVFGWDLGHIGDSHNIDSVPFDRMQQWAVEAYKRGGINTYSWHPRNIVSGGNAWDISPCVPGILPGGEYHEAFLAKLDLVADFFGSLKNEDGEPIPVVFRPWHEMTGGWFWWGTRSCTAEEYQELFRFTVDYLRDVKQLHQIIYAYSTDVFNSAEQYLTFYPGDDYVDVMGFDDYHGLSKKESTGSTISMLEILDSLAHEHSKLTAITETGLETIPNPEWFTDVVLSTIKTNSATMNAAWILFWRNGRPDHFYAPYPGHTSAEDFIKFKEDGLTYFLSDVQGIYSMGED